MKILLPGILFFILLFAQPVKATNVVIIESSISNPTRPMDSLWNIVCQNSGYNSIIYRQTKLDSTDWFCSTDVLIISSGLIDIPANRISNIQAYLAGGGRVYLQSEEGCDANVPDLAFEQITDSLGGSFNWLGSTTNGGAGYFGPIDVFGNIAYIPDTATSLDYFVGGCYGTGIGANSHITSFLEWEGLYFGFIFNVPNGCGIMITQSDEDWVKAGISTPLMTNMLTYLVNRTGNCMVSTGPLSVYAGTDTSTCINDTVKLSATGTGAASYVWSNNDTGVTASITTPGTYWVQASNNACVVRDSVNVLQSRTTFQYQLTAPEICIGSTSILSVTGATGLNAYPSGNVRWWKASAAFLSPDSTTNYLLSGQTTCGNIDTLYFSLKVDQPVAINLSTDKSSICKGDTAHLAIAGNYNSYKWSTGDTTSYTSAFVPGLYRVSVTEGACSVTDSIVVHQQNGTLQFTLSDSEICKAGLATLNITGGSGLAIYPPLGTQWQDSLQASLQPDTTTHYTITGQTTCGNNDTAGFTLQVDPLVTINLMADKNTICIGDTVFVLASGNYTSWRWSTGDSTAWLYVNIPGKYSINVSRGACNSSDSIQIKQGITSLSYLLSDSQICAGTSALLSLNGVLNATLYPDSNIVWADSAHANLQPDTSILYTIVAQTICGNIDTAVISLRVFPPIVAGVLPDSAIICAGDSTQLCVQGNFVTYAWNTDDNVDCISAKQSGDYYVTVTDNNGCSAESNHAVLRAYAASSISIVIAGDTLSSFGYNKYQWYLNDTLIPDADSAIYFARVTGYYSLTIIDSNGCSATSTKEYVTVGIQDLMQYSIRIYPNPLSAGNWQLVVDNSLLGSMFGVYNAEGRLLIQSAIRNLKSEINADDLPASIYFLTISNEKSTAVRKLVKL